MTTDARTLIEQGDTLLLQGQVTEAATAFSHAVELDQLAARAHLGVAEANFALGANDIVSIACRKVLELSPDSADGALARALLYTLDRRYDAAVFELEKVETLDPGRAYAHALRGYCLRQIGRNGDAALAEAKAARLSGSRELGKLFPKAPAFSLAQQPGTIAPANPANPANGDTAVPGRIAYQPQRPWSQRSPVERQMVRARVATVGVPVVTYTLIAINVIIYLIGAVLSHDVFSPFTSAGCLQASNTNPLLVGCANKVYDVGLVQGLLIQQSPIQAYRLFTSMFLHEGILHIGLNMWSLYAVGVITERVFNSRRFLFIYLLSGLIAGAVQVFFAPNVVALGASGAIFGIFGAFGAFVFLRRRALGPVANALIGQIVFILVLNLVFDFAVPGIGIADHVGGLVSGFILGAIFVSLSPRSRRTGSVM